MSTPLSYTTETDISQLSDPAIVVEAGGRLIQANAGARALFRIRNGKLNLQHLSAMAKPEIKFLELFTKAGQTTLQIAGQSVDAISIPISDSDARRHLALFRHQTAEVVSVNGNTAMLANTAPLVAPNVAFPMLSSELQLESEDLESSETIYAVLTKFLAEKLNAEQCAVLHHDKRRDIFYGHAPLYGLPEMISELYRFSIGSVDHGQGCQNNVWFTNDLATSGAIDWFNMRNLMNTAGIRNTMLVSLASWGDRVGAIQLSNKQDGADFTMEDAAYLRHIAPEISALMLRAHTIDWETERKVRWDVLELIKLIAESEMKQSETIPEILQLAADTLGANSVALLTLDNARGCLQTLPYSVISDFSQDPIQIDASAQDFHRTVAMSGDAFHSDDAANDVRILPLYRKYQLEHNVRSTANVAVKVGEQNLGELWFGNTHRYGIKQDDLRFCKLVALYIGHILVKQTSLDDNEQHLKERVDQLSVLVRVSRQLNQTLDLADVLEIVDLEAQKVSGISAVNVEMLDLDSMDWFDIPSTPHTEQLNDVEDFKRRVSLSNETMIVDRAITPFDAAENVSAMLIAPIVNQEVSIGLITMAGENVATFTPSVIEYIETLASQASSAIGNATRYEDQVVRSQLLRARADQLSQLLQISSAVRSDAPLKTSLEQIAYGVQESAGFNTVIISVIAQDTGELHHMAAVGLPISTFNTIQSYTLPWMRVEELAIVPENRVSNSYFLRGDVSARNELLGVEFSAGRHTNDTSKLDQWQSGDLLMVPLVGSAGEHLGAMILFDPLDHKVPVLTTIQVLEIFGNQAVLGIENTRLFAAAERRAAELEDSLTSLADQERRVSELNENLNLLVSERTADLERERDLNATLLRINTELSSSLDLDDVLARGLQLVNQSLNGDQGILLQTDLATDQLNIRCSIGDVAKLPRDNAIVFADEEGGLITELVEQRTSLIIGDLSLEERPIPLENIGDYQSLLAAPLSTGEEALGALIFLSRKKNAFNDDQLQLVAAAANQVASAINNSALYSLIRDQAERLGSMLRTQQIEASKSRAILEAVADGVMVADQYGSVILFNRSAEHILRLSRPQIIGHPVEEFLGLYGSAGKNWIETIERWNKDASNYQPGDFMVERLYLDDARVVSVHLAPVIDKNGVFIGSVSLFRDITREVEVDRLKTEFVATVSHELRTPMTAIKGYVDLMLMGATGSLSDKQVEFLNTVKSNADRLKMLVEDLLDISRMESGKVTLNKELVQIPAVVEEVAKNLQARISSGGKPAEVIVDVPEDLPAMIGDKGRLTQVFTNLMDNAYAYSPDNCTITVKAHSTPGAIQVDVIDTGIGLSQEEQNRIFDRFFRGEDSLVLGSAGTGLGLSIVQRLVEMHEGHIWATSEGRGHGSTFSVLLPTIEETGELVITSDAGSSGA